MRKSCQIVFIVGPTASGKSDIALELAQRIKGEIVCCDSMQIYKEISIASNKASQEELEKVKHYLINVASVEEAFDVARYNELANQAIAEILNNGRVPIVVGGSGLYFQILLDGIFSAEGRNETVRQRFKEMAEAMGSEALHRQLALVDPQAAGRIHPNDERRIIRALEVYETTQEPISKLQPQRRGLWETHEAKVFGIKMERELLYERINARVERMIAAGLVDEVKSLSPASLSLTAQHLIGIKEVLEYLQGHIDLETAVEKIKQNTRQFAKRQLTWFRKDARIEWIDAKPSDLKAAALEIYKELREHG